MSYLEVKLIEQRIITQIWYLLFEFKWGTRCQKVCLPNNRWRHTAKCLILKLTVAISITQQHPGLYTYVLIRWRAQMLVFITTVDVNVRLYFFHWYAHLKHHPTRQSVGVWCRPLGFTTVNINSKKFVVEHCRVVQVFPGAPNRILKGNARCPLVSAMDFPRVLRWLEQVAKGCTTSVTAPESWQQIPNSAQIF